MSILFFFFFFLNREMSILESRNLFFPCLAKYEVKLIKNLFQESGELLGGEIQVSEFIPQTEDEAAIQRSERLWLR